MSFWSTVKHFTPDEFDSPDEPGSGLKMHPILIKMLDELRDKIKQPILISSGYRTKEHNASLPKAVKDSAHLKGYAVDIATITSGYRFILLSHIFNVGFMRVGIGNNFIHLDCDPEKPHQVVWLYN